MAYLRFFVFIDMLGFFVCFWIFLLDFLDFFGFFSKLLGLLLTVTMVTTEHSQLLNIMILKFNSSILLNLQGIIFPYCPAVGAIQRINSSNIDLPGRSMLEL